MSYAILRKKTFTLAPMAPLIMFTPPWQLTCKIVAFQPIGFLKLKQIYNWTLSLVTKKKKQCSWKMLKQCEKYALL